ncbi:MAG: alpha-amylase family glycosyl hydrolase [Planctomycetes bacterium]|jgi:alpha-glucosidase|nr:alpha-amylase family glycosyl hydrolase [Planctomycetota bacterium]
MNKHSAEKHLWWQTGVIYQIYPLSFADSNGDGYGDLPGILGKLDYLKWLGVDAVWISPIYPSPLADFGYDISDHRAINPLCGTMEDFDRLLVACHERGLKVILDYVPNHTSDQHPWFLESRSSRNSPKRDWYIWKDPGRNGEPPNNWLSIFGGRAWQWDETTRQFYCHSFLKEQPDLNWRNPEVQAAMLDVMRFWLDKGVDGFRVDALWHVIKDEQCRDNPLDPDYVEGEMSPYHRLLPVYSGGQPQLHEIVALMRRVTQEYPERVLIGEMYLPVEELVRYYGQDGDSGIHLPYNFQLIVLPWQAMEIFAGINTYEASLPAFAWPTWVLGNHDKPRVASRVGPAQAKIAALLLLTLRGTPTLYYGDEIGMEDVNVPAQDARDPVAKAFPGIRLGRDPERTPMQWSAEPNAGFSSGEPWLPLAADYEQENVENQKQDAGSLLAFHRQLLELRRKEPALQIGAYLPAGQKRNVFAFVREHAETTLLIAVNLSDTRARLAVPRHMDITGEVIFGTDPARVGSKINDYIELAPDEGLIARTFPADDQPALKRRPMPH